VLCNAPRHALLQVLLSRKAIRVIDIMAPIRPCRPVALRFFRARLYTIGIFDGSAYYRIQGPKLVIEFSPQGVGVFNDARHTITGIRRTITA